MKFLTVYETANKIGIETNLDFGFVVGLESLDDFPKAISFPLPFTDEVCYVFVESEIEKWMIQQVTYRDQHNFRRKINNYADTQTKSPIAATQPDESVTAPDQCPFVKWHGDA
jgi:hypothetical protein